MHFDLAHAVVTGLLLFATIKGMRALGWAGEPKTFDWRLVLGMTFVVFLLNLIWPAG